MTTPPACPACRNPKAPSHYLCQGCWFTLPPSARTRLGRRDPLAVRRLAELLDQINARKPLHLIEISIR